MRSRAYSKHTHRSSFYRGLCTEKSKGNEMNNQTNYNLSDLLSKQRIEKILNEKLDEDYKKYMELIDLEHLKDAFRYKNDKYKVH